VAVDYLERAPVHRAETTREQDLRNELRVLKSEVCEDCDAVLNRLDRLIPAVVEIGPPALQLLVGATRTVEQMRARLGDGL
jgi:hypothetical protein